MEHYEASVEIDATPATIWQVLTDARAWESMDNDVTKVEGAFEQGARVTIHVEGQSRAFPVKVAEMAPPNAMVLKGGMPLGLFKGVRTFTVEAIGDGRSRLTTREEFSGPLLPLIWKTMPDLQPSFDRFVAGVAAAV